jgi:hypothetical protein
MGKYYCVDFIAVKGQITVAIEGLFAMSLVQATIEQHLLVTHAHQVHRTGHCAGRAPKLNMHPASPVARISRGPQFMWSAIAIQRKKTPGLS